jgi:hypothetical protein
MEFSQLRTLIPDAAWQKAVDELLQQKKAASEKELTTPVTLLQEWIAVTLAECKPRADAIPVHTKDALELDELFRKYIGA